MVERGSGASKSISPLTHTVPPLAIDVSPANRHDTTGIVPVLRELAFGGFQGAALGDLGYRGERLAKAGETLGITVAAIARGRDGQFVPAGICWVVERSLAWLSRYRRLKRLIAEDLTA
jgi:Transposase DDE domain